MTAGVFFVDVDGTLVGPEGVAPRVWPALAALREAGWRVAICTGRPGRGIALDYARRVDPLGLHVFESGAAVLSADGAVVASAPLDPALVAAGLSLAAAEGVTAEAYTAAGGYYAPARDERIRAHEALLGLSAIDGSPTPGAEIVRLQWLVSRDRWPSFRSLLRRLEGVEIHVGTSPKMPDTLFVAATRRGVSKAWGLSAALARLGLTPAGAVMMGDASNDLPALRLVGTPLAVADGDPEVRAAALELFPSAAQGGVADAAAWLLTRG